MSRTDAHTRYEYLPDGREYDNWYHRYFNMRGTFMSNAERWFYYTHGPDWNREWNSHYGRSNAEQRYARQENRSERHNAKAALRRGDYDSIPLHMTGRHSAAWLAY